MTQGAKIFVVGHEGTTGLRIHERLAGRNDIEVLSIDEGKRKDIQEIVKVAAQADIIFLCLPDQASKEIVAATKHLSCKVIDTSTAHRTDSEWAYGFAELGIDYRKAIATNRYIAVPGCHASGMIAIIKPLVAAGILPNTYPLSITSLTGYSGGGKKMIADYEAEDKGIDLYAPRHYGLKQQHKHLPEVMHVCGLKTAPIFMPVVDDYYSGMNVSIGLHGAHLLQSVGPDEIRKILKEYYVDSPIVSVSSMDTETINGCMLTANEKTGTDGMTLYVAGNQERMVIYALFDNLGKGASGAAVQCMNIALGIEETKGLVL